MAPSTPRHGLRPSATLAALLVPIRAVAFWAAILLPFLTVALVAMGYRADPPALGTLLVAYVAAVVVGHGYRR